MRGEEGEEQEEQEEEGEEEVILLLRVTGVRKGRRRRMGQC